MFRLTEGGAAVIDAVERGTPSDTAAVRGLLDRFVEAGAIHPLPEGGPFTVDDVTFVMPCFGTPRALPAHRTVVVDDASPQPIDLLPFAHHDHAELIRLPRNLGPAGARMAGLERVQTPLVVFIDADVIVPEHGTGPSWLDPLLSHFADPRVAIVAPRVTSAPGPGAVASYEMRHSPLDLGAEPARVSPGTRVSYLPAAAMVCRTDVVREVGGFDLSMRTGEDVDLVWRVVAAGHRVRYEPMSEVCHEPRPSLGAALRQRIGYGESAAPLSLQHPGALAPARMSVWSLGVWALLLVRRPLLAASVAVGTALALARKLRDVPAGDAARFTLNGHLAAGLQLARATRRVWWPLVLPLWCIRPARPWLVAAWCAPTIASALRQRSARPITDLPLAIVDDMAYGLGVWKGVVRHRAAGPLLPELSGWPQRADG
jgi:mycofactocin system glycosyltransferase